MADAAIAPNQPGGRRQRGPLNSALTGYLLAGLALLAMIAIFVYPLGYSFVMSFFRWDLSAPSAPFIGLNNYKETLTSPLFQQSLRNQLVSQPRRSRSRLRRAWASPCLSTASCAAFAPRAPCCSFRR